MTQHQLDDDEQDDSQNQASDKRPDESAGRMPARTTGVFSHTTSALDDRGRLESPRQYDRLVWEDNDIGVIQSGEGSVYHG